MPPIPPQLLWALITLGGAYTAKDFIKAFKLTPKEEEQFKLARKEKEAERRANLLTVESGERQASRDREERRQERSLTSRMADKAMASQENQAILQAMTALAAQRMATTGQMLSGANQTPLDRDLEALTGGRGGMGLYGGLF